MSPHEPTRVFLRTGRVAHLLDAMHSPNTYEAAMCGRRPTWPTTWLGTGSQREFDEASQLPMCAHCRGRWGLFRLLVKSTSRVSEREG